MKAAPFALLLLVPAFASAQFDDVRRYNALGPSVELYFPTDGTLRDAFGTSVFSFGLSTVDANPIRRTRIRGRLNFITARRGSNKLFLAPFTINVERDLTLDPEASTRPYVRAGVGAAYYDYSFRTGGQRYSNKAIGFAGNVELGVNFSSRINAFVAYNYFDRKDGVNFSGFSLGISYGLIRF